MKTKSLTGLIVDAIIGVFVLNSAVGYTVNGEEI